MADVALLERLTLASPRDLVAQTPAAGSTTLAGLYEQCRAAGLTAQPAESDIHRLHALFDVAWRHGLASFVCDYLADVCGDPQTSADPVRAYLLDGRCVADWSQKALQRMRSSVRQVLAAGLDASGAGEQLHAEALRAAGLLAVVRAVDTTDSDTDTGVASEVMRIHQTLQVCEWLLQHSLVPARPFGQHSSEQAWRSRANKRRDAAAPKPLHVADLLQRLRDVGHVDASYPPQGLKSAVELFLSGSPTVDAFEAKLAYLQYTLLDLNVPSVCVGLRDGLGLAAASVEQTRAGFLLDEAACGQDSSGALQEACRILPGIAGRDLPLSFVTALADRGALATALAVQQARVHPADAADNDSTRALQEAEAVLQITMHFGLVHEAFCQIRQHVSVSAAEQSHHARHLLHTLADLAEETNSWTAVLKLPFSAAEQAEMAALPQEPGRASVAAKLPLMLLQRGRMAEALTAAAKLPPGSDISADLSRTLTSAAGLLPATQQNLRVHGIAGRSGMLSLSQSAQADWGGDHGVAVLPSGPPSRLQTLHVGAAGQQPAPLLTGRLHPDSAGYAAPGVETQPMDTLVDTPADLEAANLEQPQQYTQTPAAQAVSARDDDHPATAAGTADTPFGGIAKPRTGPRRVKRARLGSKR